MLVRPPRRPVLDAAFRRSSVSTQSLTPAAARSLARPLQASMGATRPERAAAALFTENAPYHEMPFDAPKAGRTRHPRLLGDRDGRSARRRLQVAGRRRQRPNGCRTLVSELEVGFERHARRARRRVHFDVRRQRPLQRAARVVARSHGPLTTAPVTNSQARRAARWYSAAPFERTFGLRSTRHSQFRPCLPLKSDPLRPSLGRNARPGQGDRGASINVI